jgi:hypothetical protein
VSERTDFYNDPEPFTIPLGGIRKEHLGSVIRSLHQAYELLDLAGCALDHAFRFSDHTNLRDPIESLTPEVVALRKRVFAVWEEASRNVELRPDAKQNPDLMRLNKGGDV